MRDNFELTMDAMKSGQVLINMRFLSSTAPVVKPDFQSRVDWGEYVPLVCQKHQNALLG
jgi:hypothetical protein